jgi:hypothetical protein
MTHFTGKPGRSSECSRNGYSRFSIELTDRQSLAISSAYIPLCLAADVIGRAQLLRWTPLQPSQHLPSSVSFTGSPSSQALLEVFSFLIFLHRKAVTPSSGIGAACAIALAQAGAFVCLVYRNPAPGTSPNLQTLDAIRAFGGTAEVVYS